MKEWEQMDKPMRDLIEIIHFTENVSAKIHGVLDEAEIYKIVKEEFAKSNRYTTSIVLLTDDGSKLRIAETSLTPEKLKAGEKVSGLLLKEYKIDLNKSSIYSQVVREGKTVQANVKDIIGELFPRPLAYLIAKTTGYEREYSILTPLKRHGKITGALAMSSIDLVEHFIPSVRNLAKHISTALELADEYAERKQAEEALRRARDELEIRVQEQTAELTKANEALQAEITERKQAEERILMQNAVLNAINKVFEETLVCESDEEVARKCLAVAEELTSSKFGFIGEVNEAGRYDAIAISDPGWDACRIPRSNAVRIIKDMEIRGIWSRVLKDGKSLIVNDPASHPDSVGTPEGHPPLTAFLGVPLKYAGRTIGMIALANKESGYDSTHQEAVESLSVAFTEALMRKRAEEALEKSEQEKAVILNNMSELVTYQDADLRILWANKAASESVGLAPEQMVGRHCYEMWHQRSELCVGCPVEKVLKTGQPQEAEMNSARGEIVFIRGYPVTDTNGGVVGVVGVALDITERKRAEETLVKERNLLRTLIDNLPNSHIFVKDTRSRFITTNSAHLKTIGAKTLEDVIGKTDFDLFPQELAAQYYADEQEVIRSGQPLVNREELVIDKAGNKRWFLTTKSPLRDSSNSVVGIVGMSRDITDLKGAYSLLDEKNKELESFVYTVSHDLKAPLVSLEGFLSMLLNKYKESLDETGQLYLSRIQANVQKMEDLIQDLLELSRIGRIVHPYESVDVVEIIKKAIETLQIQLSERGTELVIQDDLPEVTCDRVRIKQVFENLIDNANKFMGEENDKPRIEIGFHNKGDFFEFFVKDNGIGIKKEYHEKVFEIFKRLGDIEVEGTGVGLTIVKKIIETHGGKIWIDSEVGKGTTVYFTLPTWQKNYPYQGNGR